MNHLDTLLKKIESQTFKIFDLLKKSWVKVFYHYPYYPVIPKKRDNMEWMGTKFIEWNEKFISSFYAVIISTDH